MASGIVDFSTAGRINAVARARIRKGIGAPGDVILSHKGTVGKVAVVPHDAPEFVCSPQTTFWRSLDQSVIDQTYLRYVLVSADFTSQLDLLKGQTDMAPYVSLTDQRSMMLSLPPVSQQRAIAGVLGALDDKIAANSKLARTAVTLAENFFKKALAPAIEERTLSDILSLEYGRSLPTARRKAGPADVYGSGGIVGTHSEALCPEPGVIVGRKGTAGAVHWSHRPFFPIDTTFYVVPRHKAVSQVFCYFLLRTLGLQEMNNHSAVPGLNRNQALASRILLPSEATIQDFTTVATNLLAMTAQVERENSTLVLTRDALLPQLMSGKLRVKDAEKVLEDAGV